MATILIDYLPAVSKLAILLALVESQNVLADSS